MKKYLESYPERPMVKLQTGQVVKTEWKGKWWLARVVQVDASLVQMYFDADKRTEWIYRGSTRLGPLFLEILKANTRQQLQQSGNAHARHRIPAVFNVSKVFRNIYKKERSTILKILIRYFLYFYKLYNFCRKVICLMLNIRLTWKKMYHKTHNKQKKQQLLQA